MELAKKGLSLVGAFPGFQKMDDLVRATHKGTEEKLHQDCTVLRIEFEGACPPADFHKRVSLHGIIESDSARFSKVIPPSTMPWKDLVDSSFGADRGFPVSLEVK